MLEQKPQYSLALVSQTLRQCRKVVVPRHRSECGVGWRVSVCASVVVRVQHSRLLRIGQLGVDIGTGLSPLQQSLELRRKPVQTEERFYALNIGSIRQKCMYMYMYVLLHVKLTLSCRPSLAAASRRRRAAEFC